MAELYQKDIRTINEHLQNLFEDGELDPGATIRKFRVVRREGTREVTRLIGHYNLDAITPRIRRSAGSRCFSTHLNRDQALKLIANLSPPLSRYRSELKLKFMKWQ